MAHVKITRRDDDTDGYVADICADGKRFPLTPEQLRQLGGDAAYLYALIQNERDVAERQAGRVREVR